MVDSLSHATGDLMVHPAHRLVFLTQCLHLPILLLQSDYIIEPSFYDTAIITCLLLIYTCIFEHLYPKDPHQHYLQPSSASPEQAQWVNPG